MTETGNINEKKSCSALGGLLNAIGTIIFVLTIIVCLSLVIPKFFGITSYTVLTGSMEPAIPVGSMVYAKYTEPSTLVCGNIVVFHDDASSIPVTHRLVENDTEQGFIITKGDANPAPDLNAIPYPDIIGKVVLHIPVAGKLLHPLGSLWGKLCLICIIIGSMLLSSAGKRAQGRT